MQAVTLLAVVLDGEEPKLSLDSIHLAPFPPLGPDLRRPTAVEILGGDVDRGFVVTRETFAEHRGRALSAAACATAIPHLQAVRRNGAATAIPQLRAVRRNGGATAVRLGLEAPRTVGSVADKGGVGCDTW